MVLFLRTIEISSQRPEAKTAPQGFDAPLENWHAIGEKSRNAPAIAAKWAEAALDAWIIVTLTRPWIRGHRQVPGELLWKQDRNHVIRTFLPRHRAACAGFWHLVGLLGHH